jgi:hypothetical protein
MILNQCHDEGTLTFSASSPCRGAADESGSKHPRRPDHQSREAGSNGCAERSIEPGKLADFLVLSGDFMAIPQDEIIKLHPLAAYEGGGQV